MFSFNHQTHCDNLERLDRERDLTVMDRDLLLAFLQQAAEKSLPERKAASKGDGTTCAFVFKQTHNQPLPVFGLFDGFNDHIWPVNGDETWAGL